MQVSNSNSIVLVSVDNLYRRLGSGLFRKALFDFIQTCGGSHSGSDFCHVDAREASMGVSMGLNLNHTFVSLLFFGWLLVWDSLLGMFYAHGPMVEWVPMSHSGYGPWASWVVVEEGSACKVALTTSFS